MTAIEIPPTPAMIHVETLEVPSKIENTAASTGPIQKLFKAKVLNVRTTILPSGKKKAYVRISPETPAIDIATQLGMV